jgi:hypothetical protein
VSSGVGINATQLTTPTAAFSQSPPDKKRRSSFSNKNKKAATGSQNQMSPKNITNNPAAMLGLEQVLNAGFVNTL